jgi:hypothetical protein
MTRQNFVAIAAALKAAHAEVDAYGDAPDQEHAAIDLAARLIAAEMRAFIGQFDRDRFLTAADTRNAV